MAVPSKRPRRTAAGDVLKRLGPDVNAVIAGFLRDMAAIQEHPQKRFAYGRAAAVVFGLDEPLDALVHSDGTMRKIVGLGPSSTRIILEVLETGGSPTVETALGASARAAEALRRRTLRGHFFSRALALRILADPSLGGPGRTDYRGDLQTHSKWSDGSPSVAEWADGALAHGFNYLALTDHSYGLAIAGGMTMAEVAEQQAEIDQVNEQYAGRFRVFKGIEANIGADGDLDLSPDDVRAFEIVLAAPHAKLRLPTDQTPRLLRAVRTPGVHVLAHPRGRQQDTRAGIIADWDGVFEAAAQAEVAIEIDGDPSRQDLDYTMARRALDAGCLLAIDTDAHAIAELRYLDTALAHARLAHAPTDRIINCWDGARLAEWLRAKRER